MGIANFANPEKAAEAIIQELDIRNPSEIVVELIAEKRGATVIESCLTSSEGRLVRKGNRGKITVPANEINLGRKRFSIGHELGHFELHATLAKYMDCSKEDMTDFSGYKRRETEANLFSAALLMPQALFFPRVVRQKPTLKLIETLADEFDTSITATACRYMQVTKEPCALIYCVDGKVRWSVKKDFSFFIKGNGDSLDQDSFAYDAFNGKGDMPRGAMVSASAWAKSTDTWLDNIEIFEATKFLEFYNSTVTLLWQP